MLYHRGQPTLRLVALRAATTRDISSAELAALGAVSRCRARQVLLTLRRTRHARIARVTCCRGQWVHHCTATARGRALVELAQELPPSVPRLVTDLGLCTAAGDVIDSLCGRRSMGLIDLRDDTGRPVSTVAKAITVLTRAGLVRRHPGRPALYSATPKGVTLYRLTRIDR